MNTWEQELKELEVLHNLAKAELEANREELEGSLDPDIETRPFPLPKRRDYLRLRNKYLEQLVAEQEKRLKVIQHNLDWDRRTL